MVDGDGVDDDGGEDGDEIPLSGVESRINLTPETKIVVAAELRIANEPPLLGLRVSDIYEGVCERGGRDDAQVAQGLGWRATWCLSWPPSSGSKVQSPSFGEKLA